MDNYGCEDIDEWLSKPGRFPNVLKPKKGGCNHDFKNSLVGPYSLSRGASSIGGVERRGTGCAACETRTAWSQAIDRCSISRGRLQRIDRAGCDARLCELHYSPSLRGAEPTWLHCLVQPGPLLEQRSVELGPSCAGHWLRRFLPAISAWHSARGAGGP